MKLRSLFALALLSLGACSASSGPNSSPGSASDALRGAEIRASGAADLYAAVAALRPSWLYYAVDSVGAPAEGSVLVFVDGRRAGDLRSLRGMNTAEIETVRLRSAAHVRESTIGLNDAPVTAGLYISRVVAANRPTRPAGAGAGVSLNVGLAAAGKPADQAFDALADAGYDSFKESEEYFPARNRNPGLMVQGGAWMGITGPLRADVHLIRIFPSDVKAFSSREGDAVGEVASIEGDVMLTYVARAAGFDLSLGLGPAVRRVEGSWRSQDPTLVDRTTTGFGGAAAATASVRTGTRTLVQVQAMARRYAPQEFAEQFGGLEMKGTTFTVTLGAGYELR
ncbi:hypothetical protein [Longimicrobium terrae]|uniref:Outer membrane protein beta-barrel domain-containing protein n=1 Tax=Longimicrobium terrae TaxID=1639882 RepID=A0A841GSV0_9BACT|nr:hypothetical protein [Longimicrobium terrae]MBB4635095.1 hypothetical protein [Longimicrobium terrae]MBB6069489.1 hypothetical protein [Longimicrobium terrae]NNC31708.1 hypothetical protein [Longimicrobium terrae]